MKPEVGSKWRCVGALNQCRAGEVVTVTAVDERFVHVEGGRAYLLRRFADGEFVPADSLSPAPAEPAKAAGWKLHDRCLIPATMVSPPEKDSDYALVELEGGSGSVWRVRVATLLPGSAPPAAAPAPHVAASVHGVDTRGVISQLADARSERDKFEASACKKELELGDKEREIARLRSALRDATAKLQRRGPL